MRGSDIMELRSTFSGYSGIIMMGGGGALSSVESLCDSLEYGNSPAAQQRKKAIYIRFIFHIHGLDKFSCNVFVMF